MSIQRKILRGQKSSAYGNILISAGNFKIRPRFDLTNRKAALRETNIDRQLIALSGHITLECVGRVILHLIVAFNMVAVNGMNWRPKSVYEYGDKN